MVKIMQYRSSLKAVARLTPQLADQITAALNTNQIPYRAIEKTQFNYLIRFKDSDTQLKAQDVLQATLGPDFTVALNLADRTPEWLLAIGAKPMKLGLDLRGGIHFLIEVETAGMLKDRISSDMHNMADTLTGQTNSLRRTHGFPTETLSSFNLKMLKQETPLYKLCKENFRIINLLTVVITVLLLL